MNITLNSTIAAIMAALPEITAKFREIDEIHKTPHTGVDFAIPLGTKLRAVGDGVVDNVVNYGNADVGKGVFIKLENGVKVLYGHLDKPLVKPGQVVKAGDVIGLSGNTGFSTGPHLHLQAYDASGKLIDPMHLAESVFDNASKFSLDKLNPFKSVQEGIQGLNDRIDKIGYWINPVNWVKELWGFLDTLFKSGALDNALIVATIGAIMLIMLGAEKPKKYIFWTWVIYFILRGFIFV